MLRLHVSVVAILFTLLLIFLQQNTISFQDVLLTPTPRQNVLPAATGEETVYPVTKVVDGDTIRVLMSNKSTTIRLIGINTPETVDPRRGVECFGMEASHKMKELLEGRKVRLVPDPSQSDRDKYDRLLRYVYRDDGVFINKQMIAEGFAYEYTYDTPYRFQKEFKREQTSAQNKGVGLWGPNGCQ